MKTAMAMTFTQYFRRSRHDQRSSKYQFFIASPVQFCEVRLATGRRSITDNVADRDGTETAKKLEQAEFLALGELFHEHDLGNLGEGQLVQGGHGRAGLLGRSGLGTRGSLAAVRRRHQRQRGERAEDQP